MHLVSAFFISDVTHDFLTIQKCLGRVCFSHLFFHAATTDDGIIVVKTGDAL